MWDGVVNQQAQVIAYINDYVMMVFVTVPAILLLLFMRHRRTHSSSTESEGSLPIAD